MNSMQLKDRLRNLSKIKNVDFNILLRLFMYDRFLERLSKSKYKDNFILKGGFYLSTLFGIESRTTMDIDMAFKSADFSIDNVLKMIKTIISVKLDDNSTIYLLGIELIRNEDLYGGYRVNLLIEFDCIKEKIHVDIATGDPITPKEVSYKYETVLRDRTISLWAYNIETVIAEKLETILERGELNGRMRDYYDIYLIYTREWGNINKINLSRAIMRTFSKRDYVGDLFVVIDSLYKSDILKKRWNQYSIKYNYAKGIEYESILRCIEIIINCLKLDDK